MLLVVSAAPPIGLLASVSLFVRLDNTLNNCMREAVYIPLPLVVKVHLKSVLAVLLPNLGFIIASIVILRARGVGPEALFAVMFTLVAVWVASSWRVLVLCNLYSRGALSIRVASVDEVR